MSHLAPVADFHAPALVSAAGERADARFWEFVVSNIRNPNTRRAYARTRRGQGSSRRGDDPRLASRRFIGQCNSLRSRNDMRPVGFEVGDEFHPYLLDQPTRQKPISGARRIAL